MEDKVSELASVAAEIVGKPLGEVHAGQVCNSKKVSDHHAIVPTMTAGSAGLSALPAGERAFLGLIAQQVLCAVGSPHIYAETAVTLDCGVHRRVKPSSRWAGKPIWNRNRRTSPCRSFSRA